MGDTSTLLVNPKLRSISLVRSKEGRSKEERLDRRLKPAAPLTGVISRGGVCLEEARATPRSDTESELQNDGVLLVLLLP
jgi:hypothetical protein